MASLAKAVFIEAVVVFIGPEFEPRRGRVREGARLKGNATIPVTLAQ